MTIALVAVTVKHERRVRLSFSVALAAGAFTTPSLYGCTNTDGSGTDPGVEVALVVANSPNVVELALGADLVGGGLYLFTAVGVPGIDSTITPNGTQDLVWFGTPVFVANTETTRDDLGALLYGTDIVHDGTDFVEDPDGDLMEVSGEENAIGALRRRMVGAPLAWAPGYSPNLRAYVDSPNANITAARGAIIRQAFLDDRVKTADATATVDPTAPDRAFFEAKIQLVGGTNPIPLPVSVPAK